MQSPGEAQDLFAPLRVQVPTLEHEGRDDYWKVRAGWDWGSGGQKEEEPVVSSVGGEGAVEPVRRDFRGETQILRECRQGCSGYACCILGSLQ